MGKTVWILGAGFSKSLGGPLLPQLFSPASELTVRKCFPRHEHLYDNESHLVGVIYRNNSNDKDGRGGRWQDAEEYLDYLDTAQAVDGPARKVITELLAQPLGQGNVTPDTIKRFALASRRLLAAECSAFLVDADLETERWQPYRRWTTKIPAGDVVITFNYDLVVEKLAKRNAKWAPGKFEFPCAPKGPLEQARVSVLKLHGSIDWRKKERSPGVWDITADADEYFALGCREEEMMIATPGPSKFSNSADGPLAPIWATAKSALKTADAIVFIGYRFPPTDSAARRNLIEAIAENDQPHLALHTVLGHDTNNADTKRLSAMLLQAMRLKGRLLIGKYDARQDTRSHNGVETWPLWAEDFLDLYVPSQL